MNTNNSHSQRIRSGQNDFDQRDSPRAVLLRRGAPTATQHELSADVLREISQQSMSYERPDDLVTFTSTGEGSASSFADDHLELEGRRRALAATTATQHELSHEIIDGPSDGTDVVIPPSLRRHPHYVAINAWPTTNQITPRSLTPEAPEAPELLEILQAERFLTLTELSEIVRAGPAYLYEEHPLVPATIVEEQPQRQDRCLPNACTIL